MSSDSLCKGVFLAATGQNIGKTTTSLAFFEKLSQEAIPLAFMKPVGQRTIEREGEVADEDVLLMKSVFNINENAKLMSPVTVPAGFTRDYLDEKMDNSQIRTSILNGWKEVTQDRGRVIVEGTGHAGVGAVFDMSNAQVASLLKLPVIIIAGGGIGRPLDELALNIALFEKEGVSVKGVIFNKARPDKVEQVREYCSKYLKKRNIEMIGVVEFSETLSHPSIRRLLMDLKAELLSGDIFLDRVPTHIVIGASVLDDILDKTMQKTLVVTPASRSDVIIAAAHNFTLTQSGENLSELEFIGLVLTGKSEPHADVLALARQSGIPILRTKKEVYETVKKIESSLAKILPTDQEKLDLIRKLYKDSIDWQKLSDIIERKI